MARSRLGVSVLGAALAAASFALAACSFGESFVAIGTVSTSVPAGPSVRFLTVNNSVGSVTLTPATGEQVSIRAAISVHTSLQAQFPTADLARDLEVTSNPDGVKVLSLHPGASSESDWKVDLVIEAPPRLHWTIVQSVGTVNVAAAGTDVAASVAAGAITVTGSPRQVELVAAAGSVSADVTRLAGGTINASAGEVKLVVHDAGPTDTLDVMTSTGSIEIELPASAALEVTLLATVGSVSVQGAPDVKPIKSVVGQRAIGNVGGGGARLNATAGVGSIHFTVRK